MIENHQNDQTLSVHVTFYMQGVPLTPAGPTDDSHSAFQSHHKIHIGLNDSLPDNDLQRMRRSQSSRSVSERKGPSPILKEGDPA